MGSLISRVRIVCTLVATAVKIGSSPGLEVLQDAHPRPGQGPPIHHLVRTTVPDVLC